MTRLLTLRALARRDGRSIVWLRALCAAGRIPGAQKLGRDWVVPVGRDGTVRVPRQPRGRPLAKA